MKTKICVYIDNEIVAEVNKIWSKKQYANEKGESKSQVVQELLVLGLKMKGIY